MDDVEEHPRGHELALMMLEFGEKLRTAREAADLSQEDLADLAGVHRTEVSLLERGRRDPQLSTILALVGPLNASVGDLTLDVPTPIRRRRASRTFPGGALEEDQDDLAPMQWCPTCKEGVVVDATLVCPWCDTPVREFQPDAPRLAARR